MLKRRALPVVLLAALTPSSARATGAEPIRAKQGMVVSQNFIASQVGVETLWAGGSAVDAAVATAFALAVTHPAAGNIGGGGFLLYRPACGEAAAYDFREVAPAGSSPTMFMTGGAYDKKKHHESHLSVGVPGTVAGLHMAWRAHGRLPWARLLEPAIALARDGFVVTHGLARSLRKVLPEMKPYPASVAQFTRQGVPYEAGDLLQQRDLASSLERIASRGPAGFYEGKTAELIEREMKAHGGLVTRADLRAYQAQKRVPLRGTYRGFDVLAMPPISSGGTALLTMLNILEGYDLKARGFGSADTVHLMAESMRRAFADRARHLGDPAANPDMPIARLVSKEHAAKLRAGIDERKASRSSPSAFEWGAESAETTHLSVIDEERNAVALTYTLEDSYGSRIVVPGAGFLLNNEMGDFNAAPGLTTAEGLIGTGPNLAAPGKRMLSSMTPTILTRGGKVFLAVGSPGGRTIINTVLEVIVNVVDFGMNIQQAIDAGRFHHQWLPDHILYERHGLSPDTVALLRARGHEMKEREDASGPQGVAEGILYDAAADLLEGGSDARAPDGAAIGR
jgi:gamma-glutamyltranspeptidase/glutathione hydrolase